MRLRKIINNSNYVNTRKQCKATFSQFSYGINLAFQIMSDTGEKISQQQEISDLKLQLNASQQIIASLELKIRQKEEIIIKTQADAIKQAHLYNSELKKLKEELNESSKVIESSSSSELEEALKAAKENESKALAELNEKIQKESKMMYLF